MSAPHEAIGITVEYVDEVGVSHDALVTAVHGPELGVHSINLVYISDDVTKYDPYGRQIERVSSVQAAGPTAARGRYYKTKLRVVK